MHRRFMYALTLACFGAGFAPGAPAQTPDQKSETDCKQLWLIDSQPADWDRYYECIGTATANVPEADPDMSVGGGLPDHTTVERNRDWRDGTLN